MAYNVFGTPITDATLKGMPEYIDKNTISRKDRANVAMNMKNSESKDVNARAYVEKLKEKFGDETSTLCLIYNASGDTIRYVTSDSRFGHIGFAPYPVQIANGQWGAFLHVKTTGSTNVQGSTGGVVYRCKDETGSDRDWAICWDNPSCKGSVAASNNKVYTEVREVGHHTGDTWNLVYDIISRCGVYDYDDSHYGFLATAMTGTDSSPICEAIITQLDVA